MTTELESFLARLHDARDIDTQKRYRANKRKNTPKNVAALTQRSEEPDLDYITKLYEDNDLL